MYLSIVNFSGHEIKIVVVVVVVVVCFEQTPACQTAVVMERDIMDYQCFLSHACAPAGGRIP